MKKSELNRDVFYTIVWSRLHNYDKYSAGRILPELPGILCLMEKSRTGGPKPLLFYGCWREGLRLALKNLMDPDFTRYTAVMRELQARKVQYKYTVVDSSLADMQDVMFWLIREYTPALNSLGEFNDSQRYENIYVKEMIMREDDVVEKIPKMGL
jgi:hypothetical protein